METTQLKSKTLNIGPDEFRDAGHSLIDRLAGFLEELPDKKITSGASPETIRSLFAQGSLPIDGEELQKILEESTDLLCNHSLFNGHPRFWGYITSSAAPAGALADLIASTINANVGAFSLSPVATEIERQTIQWLMELIGYPPGGSGVFVSGGNMANMLGFLAARRSKLPKDIRVKGLSATKIPETITPWGYNPTLLSPGTDDKQFTVYCTAGTHTWIQKAVDAFGLGNASIRWIKLRPSQQMDTDHLKRQIKTDVQAGHKPFLVIGNAGTVGTGAIDDLDEIARISQTENLWFHVDGAYGAPAAVLPELADRFQGMDKADSIALDPHKWLYSPIEAGCILVRDPRLLHDAFSYRPDYYNFEGNGHEYPLNYHEYSLQNTRGFKALKVWLSLRQAGRNGITQMIRRDIKLSEILYKAVGEIPELEAGTQNLSITTFRFVPENLQAEEKGPYLNRLNEDLLNRLQRGGEVFLSNAIINGNYYLRACIVNFRTTANDLDRLTETVLREGRKIHQEMNHR
jgi:aromatic-L-amino-acid/L-tryptophan decarboxylase